MTKPSENPLPDVAIPASDAIRKQLAVHVTEAALLRSLLKVGVRREREVERLSRLLQDGGPTRGA
jgi:hypothetical protein